MSPATVILVEDNPDDEALAMRAFRRNKVDARIRVVRDGQEAIDLLLGEVDKKADEPFTTPLIILLDLKLPRLGGLDVLKRIRADKRTANLPVIVLTTSNEHRDVEESYRLGANSFVRKPVDFDEFQETIRLVTAYWLRLNIPPSLLR